MALVVTTPRSRLMPPSPHSDQAGWARWKERTDRERKRAALDRIKADQAVLRDARQGEQSAGREALAEEQARQEQAAKRIEAEQAAWKRQQALAWQRRMRIDLYN